MTACSTCRRPMECSDCGPDLAPSDPAAPAGDPFVTSCAHVCGYAEPAHVALDHPFRSTPAAPKEDTASTDLQCGWCGNVFTHDCPGNWPAIGE